MPIPEILMTPLLWALLGGAILLAAVDIALHVRRPATGLAIIERAYRRFGVHLPRGTIYVYLRALEDEGAIESYESGPPIPERGMRQRRYYRIRGVQ